MSGLTVVLNSCNNGFLEDFRVPQQKVSETDAVVLGTVLKLFLSMDVDYVTFKPVHELVFFRIQSDYAGRGMA